MEGDGPSTSGKSGPALVRVPKVVGMTGEVLAVGMTEEAAVEMPKEVVAPVDVLEAAAPTDIAEVATCVVEVEEVVAPVDVPEAAACVVETEEVVAPVDVPEATACAVETEATSVKEIKASSASGGSEDSDCSTILGEDSEGLGSEEVVTEAIPAAAVGMAEDDGWYVSI